MCSQGLADTRSFRERVAFTKFWILWRRWPWGATFIQYLHNNIELVFVYLSFSFCVQMAASIEIVRNVEPLFLRGYSRFQSQYCQQTGHRSWMAGSETVMAIEASQLITTIGDSAPAGKVYQEGAEIGRPTYPSINNCLWTPASRNTVPSGLPTDFPFPTSTWNNWLRPTVHWQDVRAETRQGCRPFFKALVKELKRTRVDDDLDLEWNSSISFEAKTIR